MLIDKTDTVWYRGKEILLQDAIHAAITISDLFGEVVGAVFGKALLSENGDAKARICSRVHNMNVDRIADMCTMIQMASNENFEGKNTQKYFPTKQSLKDTIMNIADYAFVLYDGILRCYDTINTLDDDMPIDAIGEFVSVDSRAFNMASLYMRHGRLYTNYVKKHKKEGEFIEVPDNFKLSDNNTFYIKTRTNYLKECIMNCGLVFKKFDLDSEKPSIRYKIFLQRMLWYVQFLM